MIIIGGFRIVENTAELLQVRRAQQVRDVLEGLEGQKLDGFRIDGDDFPAADARYADIVAGQLAIRGLVGSQRKHRVVLIIAHGLLTGLQGVNG